MNNWRKNFRGSKAVHLLLILGLLVAHTFKLHMHVEHGHTSLPGTETHIVDVHAASYLHDLSHDSIHHDNLEQNHEHDTVDVGSTANNLVKKVQILNPFVFFILVLFIILTLPRLCHIQHRYHDKKPRTFAYLFPPQRAPPIF